DRRRTPDRSRARRHRLADLERRVSRAVHDQHRETDEPGEQRKGAQKTKETAGVDRSRELIEVKRQSEEEISEGHAEQERRHGAAEEQRPVTGVAPAGIKDLVAIEESDRSEDQRDR